MTNTEHHFREAVRSGQTDSPYDSTASLTLKRLTSILTHKSGDGLQASVSDYREVLTQLAVEEMCDTPPDKKAPYVTLYVLRMVNLIPVRRPDIGEEKVSQIKKATQDAITAALFAIDHAPQPRTHANQSFINSCRHFVTPPTAPYLSPAPQ